MKAGREFVPNQVFVGLPWKNVRPRYDKVIARLEKKFPLYFTIVGRDDGQGADDLFQTIKSRIVSSSWAIFDATGGNANVSLEYGFAEGVDVQRSIFMSTHKASHAPVGDPIISDLGGKRRIQYKTEVGLSTELHRFSREHAYTVRFEKAFRGLSKNLSKGSKKTARALALKVIHVLDGRSEIRRAELVQALQAQGYEEKAIDAMLRSLHNGGVIVTSVGRYSDVREQPGR
jgi:hypothetical protein